MYEATVATPLYKCVQAQFLLIHHCVTSDHLYKPFRLFVDIECTRTVASRAVKYPNLHVTPTDCKCVNVPASGLAGENVPYISADLEKRPFFVVVGLL